MEANDTLIESISAPLLEQLRNLRAQQLALETKARDIIGGYVMGKGWDVKTHNVNFDENSGMATLSPIPAPAAESPADPVDDQMDKTKP